MRIFSTWLSTETNTFAPWPTTERDFVEIGPRERKQSNLEDASMARELQHWATRDGHELFTSVIAFAEPSGPTLQAVYEGFRDRILDDFRAYGPFDVALLFLHGAMIATGCDDCEGDLIGHLRRVGGRDLVIGVELDPHCHLTGAMIDSADAIILMKEYPHTDFLPRARELFDICIRARRGAVQPAMAVFDCRMVGSYPTTEQPMHGLLAALRAEERKGGILSISFVHGFPWGDTAEAGSKVLVVADNDPALASRVAEKIGRMIYGQRQALLPNLPGIDQALDRGIALRGRIVLADTADNAGGGAPGDNVSLLRAMIARGAKNAVFGCVWDPLAVGICASAGVGAKIGLSLGGKCGPASGEPLDCEATIRGVLQNHSQQGLGGTRVALGAAAWIEISGIDVLVNSQRTQTLSPDAFTGLGIDLADKHLIAVKSTQHFRANFAALADEIIRVATPGALQADFSAIEYRKKRDLDYFPRIADPLSADRPEGVA